MLSKILDLNIYKSNDIFSLKTMGILKFPGDFFQKHHFPGVSTKNLESIFSYPFSPRKKLDQGTAMVSEDSKTQLTCIEAS